MIRNIVFDMGNVMIYFRKDLFLDQAGVSGEDRTLLARVVFDSLEWARLDRGSLLEDEAERIMCARLPERLHDKVHYFVYDWDKPLRPVRDMAPLVRELKAKGYGIYLLSNAASRQHVYWPDIPGSECFDGTLISADELLTKPEREIYELFLSRFALDPDECVFIDDNTMNAEGAFRCGMHPIVFHNDVDELRARLREEGVEV
jgi:putative hydrolase of the HAD superfamily